MRLHQPRLVAQLLSLRIFFTMRISQFMSAYERKSLLSQIFGMKSCFSYLDKFSNSFPHFPNLVHKFADRNFTKKVYFPPFKIFAVFPTFPKKFNTFTKRIFRVNNSIFSYWKKFFRFSTIPKKFDSLQVPLCPSKKFHNFCTPTK